METPNNRTGVSSANFAPLIDVKQFLWCIGVVLQVFHCALSRHQNAPDLAMEPNRKSGKTRE